MTTREALEWEHYFFDCLTSCGHVIMKSHRGVCVAREIRINRIENKSGGVNDKRKQEHGARRGQGAYHAV